jgi:rhamnulokinase
LTRLAAVDLGAESGRVVVGELDGERLSIQEVHRFGNVPVRLGGTLYWDFLHLFDDVVRGIGKAGEVASVGVDTWGVDYGLLDRHGRLIGNPVHYRDARTQGVPERVSRADVYAATGIQFMPINTLYQLLAEPDLERADRLLLMPDLINHFLCGSTVGEYTIATTTQCYDVRQGDWARDLLGQVGIPERIFPPVVPPGTVLGELDAGARPRVVATASHDTASAVAAVPLSPGMAYLSSGTWSLLGLELHQPVVNAASLQANLTNEGGVAGTIRLLKNVMGLWLVQQARRGHEDLSYADLTALAEQAPAWTAFVDPDDERFLRPGDLSGTVQTICQETGQPPPTDIGTLVRVLLESVALKCAAVVRQLELVSGQPVTAISVVGGGARNELLCRLTASATGRPVLAGASEATAIGNLLVQAMALGELASLSEARELVAHSFPARTYEPEGDWSEARHRFEQGQGVLA